jgi:hypothetical protein
MPTVKTSISYRKGSVRTQRKACPGDCLRGMLRTRPSSKKSDPWTAQIGPRPPPKDRPRRQRSALALSGKQRGLSSDPAFFGVLSCQGKTKARGRHDKQSFNGHSAFACSLLYSLWQETLASSRPAIGRHSLRSGLSDLMDGCSF